MLLIILIRSIEYDLKGNTMRCTASNVLKEKTVIAPHTKVKKTNVNIIFYEFCGGAMWRRLKKMWVLMDSNHRLPH